MDGLDEVTREFVSLFETMDAQYAVMGGLAVRLHALPRATFDADFTASIPRAALPALYEAAEKHGFKVPAAQTTGWIDSVRGLPVIKFQWFVESRSIDVDVFLAETPFQNELLKRRQRHRVDHWEAWFVTAEDLILLKLLADRPKDRVDVSDIIFIQGSLDEAYLHRWAIELGLEDALKSAFRAQRD